MYSLPTPICRWCSTHSGSSAHSSAGGPGQERPELGEAVHAVPRPGWSRIVASCQDKLCFTVPTVESNTGAAASRFHRTFGAQTKGYIRRLRRHSAQPRSGRQARHLPQKLYAAGRAQEAARHEHTNRAQRYKQEKVLARVGAFPAAHRC